MLGYGLLSAGIRRGDEGLVRSGVRAVGTALATPPAQRGVFDLLGVSAAYDLARRRLADDPAFRRASPALARLPAQHRPAGARPRDRRLHHEPRVLPQPRGRGGGG